MTKTGNCTLCGRGNCLANDKAKSKAKKLNSLAPIATNNILKALRIAADHSVDEMIEGSETYELFSNYVRKACDAIHAMNNIDCRLLSTIFGLQSKARYFGKSAGSVRNSLSHVDMDQPDPHVLYLAVTIHFPSWYNIFCGMHSVPLTREKLTREQVSKYHQNFYNQRLRDLTKLPDCFVSKETHPEDMHSNARLMLDGGPLFIGFPESDAPYRECLLPPPVDEPFRWSWSFTLEGYHFVSHNPLWAWQQEMSNMYRCEFAADGLHPKGRCLWQEWDKLNTGIDFDQTEAEFDYIKTYELYNNTLPSPIDGPEQSLYDVLLLHLSSDSPAPVMVHPLPADQNLTPEERFHALNRQGIAEMFIREGVHPNRILDVGLFLHGTPYEGRLLKRAGFVAHVTFNDSKYSWVTDDETPRIVWSSLAM